MKTKLVLWGTNANDERVLIAMELRPELNQVGIWQFPEQIATDEFAQQLFDEWRESKEVPFPEGFSYREQELTMTEGLLPEDIKVERGDIVQRAQAEWHFIVLSSKLKEAYHTELDELKERVEKLESFDESIWNNLKDFWEKVQNQVRERNLFRDHIDSLRENTNHLFDRLKELRKKMDDEFSKRSKETMQKFMGSLEEIEQKVKEGLRLQSAFDELKKLQREYRDAQLTRDHRSKVWDRLDGAFKAIKEKRFGSSNASSSQEDSPLMRIQRRYQGLVEAITKMERSIQRDRDDLNFQHKKIETTDGQLEAQIRQAKIGMIEERIRSKEEKLHEMVHTRTELESRMEQIRHREAKQAEKERLEEAKEAAKGKIAEQIKQQQEAMEEMADKLEKAADSLTGGSSEPEPSFLEKLQDAVEDAVDTAKAVAEVVSEKVEDAAEVVMDKVEDAAEAAKDKMEDVVETIKDKVEDAAEVVEDKVEELLENKEEEEVKEEEKEEDKKEE